MAHDSWYRTWFDSPYYHILYRHRDLYEAARFIDRLFKYLNPDSDAEFLDLACGKGRHSRTIAAKGYRVTGIDLSESNIREAQRHADDRLKFHIHDMREPLAPNAFDYVLNLFTSFGYFDSLEENEKVLASTAVNLKPKGKLVIDFLNAHRVISGLVPEETIHENGVRFDIHRELEAGVIRKHIRVNDGDKTHRFEERVRALTKADFSGMLSRTGFEILDIFGNYGLEKFEAEMSPRLILIARKRV